MARRDRLGRFAPRYSPQTGSISCVVQCSRPRSLPYAQASLPGSQAKCPLKSPQTGAKFNFWHPRLITLHFWVWYPNPSGLYSGTNPIVSPYNHG
jgi:hypothetical protein